MEDANKLTLNNTTEELINNAIPMRDGRYVTHDGQDILKTRILMNKMSKDVITYQIKHSHASANLHLLIVKTLKTKRKLVNEMTEILESELSVLTKEGQQKINNIDKKLGDIDANPHSDIIKYQTEMKDYEHKMYDLLIRLRQLNNTLPEQTTLTKYVARLNMGDTCAKDAV